MVDYQTISIVLTGIGLMLALTYYALQIRNQYKSREAQWFMQLYERKTDFDSLERFFEHMGYSWKDYNDYLGKYDSNVNSEGAAVRHNAWAHYDGLGMMVRRDMVDMDMIYDLFGWRSIAVWFKWETIIKKLREGALGVDFMADYEYLVNEMIKIRKKRGVALPTVLLHPSSTLFQELGLKRDDASPL